MKCKYCQAQLEEDAAVCPVCGRSLEQEENALETALNDVQDMPEEEPVEAVVPEQTAEPEATPEEEVPVTEIKEGIKATPGKIALAIAAVVVVLALLVALVISGIDGITLGKPDSTQEPASETTDASEPPATIPSDGNPDDATCKGSYTAGDEEVRKEADAVVATIGDIQLTNGDLQVFYWMEVYAFLQSFGDYADYFGLDYAKPLDTQLCELGDIPMTWQQYFLQCALDSWGSYQALVLQRDEEGYQIPDDFREFLDGIPEELAAIAVQNGYEDLAAQVVESVGAGATEENYIHYARLYESAYAYYTELCEAIAPSEAEITAYFAENESGYAEEGITRDSGKYVDVRHILLKPEGDETDENGYPVYTDDAWEACRVEAQEIYDQWMQGDMTEDSFAQFAQQYSVDGSAVYGGLYTDVYVGQMVPEFEEWCFDESRQVGDHGLVKTVYGYHIMFFSGSRDVWYATAQSDLILQRANEIIPAAMQKYPAAVDYSVIKLGLVDLVA